MPTIKNMQEYTRTIITTTADRFMQTNKYKKRATFSRRVRRNYPFTAHHISLQMSASCSPH